MEKWKESEVSDNDGIPYLYYIAGGYIRLACGFDTMDLNEKIVEWIINEGQARLHKHLNSRKEVKNGRKKSRDK